MFADGMRPSGSRDTYRIVATDLQSRSSPGPGETCQYSFVVTVEFPNLLSFLLLLGGVLSFLSLIILILILISKTRKIDLEIGRLIRMAEMHSVGSIQGSEDVNEPMIPSTPDGAGDAEDFVMVKALEHFDAPGPGELAFQSGTVIRVRNYSRGKEWLRGELGGMDGIFPAHLVRVLPPPLPVHSPSRPEPKKLDFRDDDFNDY